MLPDLSDYYGEGEEQEGRIYINGTEKQQMGIRRRRSARRAHSCPQSGASTKHAIRARRPQLRHSTHTLVGLRFEEVAITGVHI